MALAVLILGYREPAILSRVMPIYRRAGFDVYVHVDVKMPLDEYMNALGASASQCSFIPARERVYWAGWSMVQATFNLLDAARSTRRYDNFLLVSDDTLPIVSVEYLQAMLQTSIERISARPICDDEVFADRYKRFFFLDHPATSLHGRPIESSFVDDIFISTIERIQHRRRFGKVEIPIYYGAQWWCLTARAIDMIFELHEERLDLRESFEFSAVPDEIYLQTLIANFIRPHEIAGSPVYVDWSRQQKPHVYSDFSFTNAISAHHLFIRKVSARNIQFVEEALRGIE